eukprot:COSAG04_NODE_13053_length_622_cov_1.053537_1_plen_38_part_10
MAEKADGTVRVVGRSYVGEKCNLWRMYRDIYSQWPIIE